MNVWAKWLRQPQSVLLRRILFQVHLWVGVALGLYILVISLTGSLLVYRREMTAAVGPVYVTPQAHRLTQEELGATVRRAYPGFTLESVFTPRNRGQAVPNQAIEVRLRRGDDTIGRLLDPYTGTDLGDPQRPALTFILRIADLHDDLLAGHTGRLLNGIGAIFTTLLASTGAMLWWTGIRNWRRSLTIDWRRKRHGFNWSLHSAVGFWMLAFVLLWGISGIYFAFPRAFNATVDFFEPLNGSDQQTRVGDTVLFWLARLHFGRFSGLAVKAIWTVLGLAPAVLAVTGSLMWWHRVVRRKPQALDQQDQLKAAPTATVPTRHLAGDEPNQSL
jgi:uncharacterized iron-regulated membrane protein